MRLTVISGPRDSGKTAAAAGLAERLHGEGCSTGGILSEAELRLGVKSRYAFRDLMTGEKMTYAMRRGSPVRGGELAFEFLSAGLAFGSRAIRNAFAVQVDALFVDEIGPLEQGGQGLWAAVQEVRGAFSGRFVVTVRSSLLDWLVTALEPDPESLEVIRL